MYDSTFEAFKVYWLAYGGLKDLLRSFYLMVAGVLLALTFNIWWTPTFNVTAGQWSAWWDQNLGILPNLLGFTLGGFAIFMGFGDEKFRKLLAEPDGETALQKNAYVQLCATFVHFILVQVLALLAAVLCKAFWFYLPWMDPVRDALPWLNAMAGAIGYGLFLYALTCVVAATMHIFRIAMLYAKFMEPAQTADQSHTIQ